MPLDLSLPPADPSGTPPAQAVYLRNAWSDAWVLNAELHCDQVSFGVSPGISTASFSSKFGAAMKWATPSVTQVAKQNAPARSYVRVVITSNLPGQLFPTREFVGIWRSATDKPNAQTFQADGIEALLSYHTIVDAWYYDFAGGIRKAGRGLIFNEGGKPNRSANTHQVDGDQSYIFDDKPSRAKKWSSRNMVDYLLNVDSPRKADGSKLFEWQLQNASVLPDYDSPTFATHGKTTLDILQAIIDRRRLMSFFVDTFAPLPASIWPTMARVHVFSFADSAVTVRDHKSVQVGTMPANPSKFNLRTSSPSASVTFSTIASHIADQVIVTGGRRQSVFSVGPRDDSLVIGWHEDDKVLYEEGASKLETYPSATSKLSRAQYDRRYRDAEHLQHVYLRYSLHPGWNQIVGDGTDDIAFASRKPIAIIDDDASKGFRLPWRQLKILGRLPFRRGYDYDGSTIADQTTAGELHRGKKKAGTREPHEVRDTFVLARIPSYKQVDWKTEAKRYEFIDRIARGSKLEIQDLLTVEFRWAVLGAPTPIYPVNRDWSARVKIEDDTETKGFRLQVYGAEPHILTRTDYNPTRDEAPWIGDESDTYRGAWDYADLIWTVAIEETRDASASWPTGTPTPQGEFLNVLRIDAGDQYKLIYVTPNTVVDVDPADASIITSDGGFVQDDRGKLAALARRAFEWYSKSRRAVQLATGYFPGDFWLGTMVSNVIDEGGTTAVNSVVSEISVSFPRGSKIAAVRCNISTQFAELDVESFL